MLVLSRQRDETIAIGGGFKVGGVDITIVDIRGDKVRLGINAPKEISVHRQEVQDDIAKSNRASKTLKDSTEAALKKE